MRCLFVIAGLLVVAPAIAADQPPNAGKCPGIIFDAKTMCIYESIIYGPDSVVTQAQIKMKCVVGASSDYTGPTYAHWEPVK